MNHPDTGQLHLYLTSDSAVDMTGICVDEHLEHCTHCRNRMEEFTSFSIDQENQVGVKLIDTGGRYLFLEKIGRGGMAEVFRCHDSLLRRDVAIKVVRPDLAFDADALRRFDQEARVCARLQHPGVVPVHDFGNLADGRPFIAMKCVKGKALETLLQQHRQANVESDGKSTTKLLNTFLKLTEAMAYVHQSGVVHRDLKPQNIKIGAFGETQIMDWGIAKIVVPESEDDHTTANCCLHSAVTESKTGIVGTPGYMAPEQSGMSPEQSSMDSHSHDQRTDVYALGLILCEVLGCERVLPQQTAISPAIRKERIDNALLTLASKSIEFQLISLVDSCLFFAPSDRPADAGKVAEALSHFLSTQRKQTKDSQLAAARAEARVASERKRRLQVTTLASLLAVAMLVGSIWYSFKKIQQHEDQVALMALVDLFLVRNQEFKKQNPNDQKHRHEDESALKEARRLHQSIQTLMDDAVDEPMRQKLAGRSERLSEFLMNTKELLQLHRDIDGLLAQVEIGRRAYRERYDTGVDRISKASTFALPLFDRAFQEFTVDCFKQSESAQDSIERIPASRAAEVMLAINEWILLTHCSGKQQLAKSRREILNAADSHSRRRSNAANLWAYYDSSTRSERNKIGHFALSTAAHNDSFAMRLAYVLLCETHGHEVAIKPLRRNWIHHLNDFHLNWELGCHWVQQTELPSQTGDTATWGLSFFQKCFQIHRDHHHSIIQISRVMHRVGQHRPAMNMLEKFLSKADILNEETLEVIKNEAAQKSNAAIQAAFRLEYASHQNALAN